MPLYFLMGTHSENGQQMLLRNPNLLIESISDCRCPGAQILGSYAVLGRCDYVMMVEADDNEAVGRLALEIGVRAGIHTETMPAMAIGGMVERAPDDAELVEQAAEAPSAEGWRLPTAAPDTPAE